MSSFTTGRFGFLRLRAWLGKHRWALASLFVGVLVPLFLFGRLADEVLEQEPLAFDKPILLFLHSHTTPWLDTLMLALSLAGYSYGVVPVAIAVPVYLFWRRRWGDAVFWSLALGGAGLINLGAKAFFGRIRPDLWLSPAPETTLSFPSGHAMGSMACVAAALVLVWPTAWRWPALILGGLFVLGVGVSRIYLGVHYPSDILAGWAAALSWVFGVSLILYGHLTKPSPATEPT